MKKNENETVKKIKMKKAWKKNNKQLKEQQTK